MHQQPLKIFYQQATVSGADGLYNFQQHLSPLFYGKERTLVRIDQYGDDDFVKEFAAAFDDVQMAVRHGVE
jgi:hypothetical protein